MSKNISPIIKQKLTEIMQYSSFSEEMAIEEFSIMFLFISFYWKLWDACLKEISDGSIVFKGRKVQFSKGMDEFTNVNNFRTLLIDSINEKLPL